MDTADKVRENRLRRMASRQGLRLVKSRRKDPRAGDYGTYIIVDADINCLVAGGHGDLWDLEDVERFLTDREGPDGPTF